MIVLGPVRFDAAMPSHEDWRIGQTDRGLKKAAAEDEGSDDEKGRKTTRKKIMNSSDAGAAEHRRKGDDVLYAITLVANGMPIYLTRCF